ncbi:MAG: TetR/AcrR family transcriptional regulator, partial [Sporichthyaceae bacterium]|nr:TetR/AcrR family transcriptional regulator [Sporichthyaceae bacterium]
MSDGQMKSSDRRPYTMRARAEGVAATRDRIAQATLRLALEQPYEDITLAAIAQAAGVSHQTVLNHFESKEGAARA